MNKTLFKITFYDNDHKPSALHAEKVYQSDIFGFIEADRLTFPEPSEIIVTPEDDKSRQMFKNVKRTLIPMSMIIRIDEVISGESPKVINISEAEK